MRVAPGVAGPGASAGQPGTPVFALAAVGCTLPGFVAASAAGVNPAWAAAAGAAVLATRALTRRAVSAAGIWRAADVPFLLFVVSLGIVVRAVVGNGHSAPRSPA